MEEGFAGGRGGGSRYCSVGSMTKLQLVICGLTIIDNRWNERLNSCDIVAIFMTKLSVTSGIVWYVQ